MAAARTFVEEGAEWIHVVDMDLAFEGRSSLGALVEGFAGLGAEIQASGGITSGADVEAALAAGASRVVIGSGALRDRETVQELVDRHGDRVAAGVEIDGDSIRARGTSGAADDFDIEETLSWFTTIGVLRLVVTLVRSVGTMGGVDADRFADLVRRSPDARVIAAGGVSDAADIAALAGTGVEAAIVGSALYEGRLTLSQAIAAAR